MTAEWRWYIQYMAEGRQQGWKLKVDSNLGWLYIRYISGWQKSTSGQVGR